MTSPQTSVQPVGQIVAPTTRALEDLAERLRGWLAPRLPEANGLRIVDPHYPRGAGQSHETILFTARWQHGRQTSERRLVVRIKPTTFTVFLDDMFREEYELMRALHEDGTVPVAEVLWFEEDPSHLGAPFFVMEQIFGRVPVSIPSYMEEGWLFDAPAEFRSRVWLGGLHAMASLQRVPPSTFAFLDRPDVGDGFAQEWDRWERFSDTLQGRRRIPFLEAARRRLHETLPDNRPAGLVWGDARLGNIMFDHEGEVVALMDWEQPSLGGALQDLGWWLFNDRAKVHARGGTILEGIGGRDETIAIWEASTGLSAAEVDWYEQFAGFKMVCLLVNMMDMRGETPPSGDYADIWNARVAGPLLGLRPGDW